MNDLNFLDELLLKAYECASLYKDKMMKYHDQRFKNRDFVLLFNSRLHLFHDKLKSKWSGPFLIKPVFPNGAVNLDNSEGIRFKVKIDD